MAWSAASAASGGKPYPQIAAVPASSRHSSTRGSFSASSRRLRAASGPTLITARPIAARICPGGLPVTLGDDGGFGSGGGRIAQHPGGLRDHLRFIVPDDPLRQGLPGQGQPGSQIVRHTWLRSGLGSPRMIVVGLDLSDGIKVLPGERG